MQSYSLFSGSFFTNVFSQLATEALQVSQNQTVSGIVENFLKQASEENILLIFKAFRVDWELACTDRFVSHVTQTLLLCANKELQ